jgi:hypothetical protein
MQRKVPQQPRRRHRQQRGRDACRAAGAVRAHLDEFDLPVQPVQDRQCIKSFLQAMENEKA